MTNPKIEQDILEFMYDFKMENGNAYLSLANIAKGLKIPEEKLKDSENDTGYLVDLWNEGLLDRQLVIGDKEFCYAITEDGVWEVLVDK